MTISEIASLPSRALRRAPAPRFGAELLTNSGSTSREIADAWQNSARC